MPKHQINPRFIHALTGEGLDSIPVSPINSAVKGNYIKTIRDNRKSIGDSSGNEFMLTCKACGRKGKYDVGLVVVNPDFQKEDEVSSYLQLTGYFRCKHCNAAGEWKDSNDIKMLALTAMMGPEMMSDRCHVGQNSLFDGTSHQYATDAEEHLLTKILARSEDAYLWNRLGNLYRTGGRPELAMAAYEKSVAIHQGQIESHYSIAHLLEQAGDIENAAFHYHQLMLSAASYHDVSADTLRTLIALSLREMVIINQLTSGKVPIFPSREQTEESGMSSDSEKMMKEFNHDVDLDNLPSFYPLAEMFMGERIKEIPLWDRQTKPVKVQKKKKPRKKKRKKK
ncbi:tetratricopeptide repeat protein [Bacillus salacetis]|uniref:tetratricopeptide repeat protein n=1 Tax=Bacillus salacetis TaxID=2315464 RepID=UPI003B9F2C32